MNQLGDYLYSLVLKLVPQTEVKIQATMGHQVHAAFLGAVKETDPALAEVLHYPGLPLRPFTVSPLRGAGRARKGEVLLTPERDYFLRFTILYIPIFRRFMERFLNHRSRPVIRLGGAKLLIKEILVTPGSHPWACYTSWPELAAKARPLEEIVLEFASPTAFSFGQRPWGKKVVPLPLPELVFGSLMRTWGLLAPPELQMDEESLKAYIGEEVVIKRIVGLRTAMLRFPEALQVGFMGRITYGLMADDEDSRAQLNALADFALYAGVGMKTTMGMGQCRRIIQ